MPDKVNRKTNMITGPSIRMLLVGSAAAAIAMAAENCVYQVRHDGVCGTSVPCNAVTKREVVCSSTNASCIDGTSYEKCTPEAYVGRCALIQHTICGDTGLFVSWVSTNNCSRAFPDSPCAY
jgi:hypothetical protein